MTNAYIPQLVLMLLALILSACTGSHSSGTTTPIQSRSLSVLATSPASDSTQVSRSTAITASFDRSLLGRSVDNSSFTLRSGTAALPATVQLDPINATDVNLTGVKLKLLTTYTAQLSTDITDLLGHPLSQDYSWNFTTADGEWGEAETLDAEDESALYPQISSDANGNSVAVWMQSYQGQGRIWIKRYYAETATWGDARVIHNLDIGGAAQFPHIATDTHGNSVLVWKQEQGVNLNTYSMWSSYYDVVSDMWSAPEPIGLENEDRVAYAKVVFDHFGNAIAVWNQSEGGEDSIWVNHYAFETKSWGNAIAIEQSHQTTYKPDIAVHSNGNALVVWHQRDASAVKSIWANNYQAATKTWGVPQLIENGESDATIADGISNVQVAMDASGDGIAVWSQSDGTVDSIWVNHYDLVTASWGDASLIETGAGNARAPKIATDRLGNAMVLWYQDNGRLETTHFNQYSAVTQTWGDASEIEVGAGHAYKHQLAYDDSHNAIAIWRQADGGIFSLRAIRYSAQQQSWGSSVKIEQAAGEVDHPQLSIDGAGNAFAIWQQDDSDVAGTQNDVIVNRFD